MHVVHVLPTYLYAGDAATIPFLFSTTDTVMSHRYESDETPMRQFLNTHTVLDERRAAARASGGQGPRCMVVGPTDVGKSSLCKILLNYAVRMGWCPTYIDLDIGV